MRLRLLPALALVAGCGLTTQYTSLNPPPHAMPEKRPEQIEMFAGSPPSRPHVDVELIRVEQESSSSPNDNETMMAELRKQAAQFGCDGVVLLGRSERTPSPLSADGYVGTGRLTSLEGTCIVYTSTVARR